MFSVLLTLLLASTTLDTPLASSMFSRADEGQPIHFNSLQNKCLDVRGAVFANGTPVQMFEFFFRVLFFLNSTLVLDMIATAPKGNVGSSTKAAPLCKSRGPTSVSTLVQVSGLSANTILHM
jgi:hypothetical protein